MSVGVVVNPSKISRKALADAFTALRLPEPLWFETSVADPGVQAATAAMQAGCEVVIAAGGDGTVRAVAEALAGSDTPLGIVPRGTGNLLARNLGIPLGGIKAALRRVFDSSARRIDLGWVELDRAEGVERRAFVVMTGFGIDAHMLAETNDDLKKRAGWLAYVEAMGRAISATELVEMTVQLDEHDPVSLSAHTMLIGNCGMLQAGMTLLPDAAIDDGMLDLLGLSATGPLQWAANLMTTMWDNGLKRVLTRGEGELASTDSMRHIQLRRVRVDLDEPRAFEIDGEEVGEVNGFTAWVDAGALWVR